MFDSYEPSCFVEVYFLIYLQCLYCQDFDFIKYCCFTFIRCGERLPFARYSYLVNLFEENYLRLLLFVNCFAAMSYSSLLFNSSLLHYFLIYGHYLFQKKLYFFLSILLKIMDHFVFFNWLNLQFILKDF
jgi:hypothetical protein